MHRYTFSDNDGNTWRRVNATQARNAFINGESVTMCHCNLRPWGYWCPQFTVNRDDDAHAWELGHYGARGLWDMIVNSATAYNCTCSETGMYLSYYLVNN